jgi:hypothetical protein
MMRFVSSFFALLAIVASFYVSGAGASTETQIVNLDGAEACAQYAKLDALPECTSFVPDAPQDPSCVHHSGFARRIKPGVSFDVSTRIQGKSLCLRSEYPAQLAAGLSEDDRAALDKAWKSFAGPENGDVGCHCKLMN